MSHLAVLATQLTTGAAHPWGLFVDGLDVLKEPATPSTYGVEWQSISILEAAPGNVSRMDFTIDDVSRNITIAANAKIMMWDFTRDLPVFVGFVENVSQSPDFGQRGRSLQVSAYGIEALLDLIIVPSYQTDNANALNAARSLQGIAASAPLRAFTFASNNPASISSQAQPIANTTALGLFWFSADTQLEGGSIRSTWETFWRGTQPDTGWNVPFLTVDFWEGLRLWAGPGSPFTGDPPSDYATITITEALGSAGAGLTWVTDTSPGSIITAVYVKGGNAAGTGWVTGDATQGRSEAFISDASILTENAKRSAGGDLLGRSGTGAGRGTITLENITPVNAHPGSPLVITSTGLGWAAKAFTISEIRKTFDGPNKQNWTISFYEAAAAATTGEPSGAGLIRTITRSLGTHG